jgi:hypothetical protein
VLDHVADRFSGPIESLKRANLALKKTWENDPVDGLAERGAW